eukprot:746002-Hanusia_phi.AAC.1
MKKFMERQEALEQLENELRRREQVLEEKEETLKQKAALELKRGRKEEEVRRSLMGLEKQLAAMDEMQSQTSEGSKAIASSSLPEHKDWTSRKVALLQQRQELARSMASEKFLSQEEERRLAEIEERLEALDMEVEYKSASIAELEQTLQ